MKNIYEVNISLLADTMEEHGINPQDILDDKADGLSAAFVDSLPELETLVCEELKRRAKLKRSTSLTNMHEVILSLGMLQAALVANVNATDDELNETWELLRKKSKETMKLLDDYLFRGENL